MKKFFILAVFFFPIVSYGYATGIYDVWDPEAPGEPYLILATDGKVHEASAANNKLIKKLQEAKNSKSFVELELFGKDKDSSLNDKRRKIKTVTLLQGQYDEADKDLQLIKLKDDDDPSYSVNAMSMDEAKRYFETMRTDTRDRSQCYNRAHVWVYELFKYYNIGTMKNWMFFTKRYIREYRYHWWFHVTPFTIVHDQGQVTLDRKFMRAPLPIVEWKDFFMRNKAPCAKIQRYSSYRDNQESNYCYWIQTNMYFWQPYQIENLENGDPERWGWVPREINTAYGDAL